MFFCTCTLPNRQRTTRLHILTRLSVAALTLAATSALSSELPESEGTFSRVGLVKTVRGNAQLLHATGTSLVLEPGSEVNETDQIVTDADSGVSIVLRDGARLVVGPSSRLDMKKFHFNPVTHEGGIFLSLITGSMRMVTGLIGKHHPEAERIETPTAVIGIRGTDFIVNVNAKP